jgi:hypothetical protein
VKNSARADGVVVSADGRGLVWQAGAVVLWETMRVTGLARGLSAGLARWRAPGRVMKSGLGNHAAATLDQLEALVRSRLRAIQRRPELINALLGQTGLTPGPPQ